MRIVKGDLFQYILEHPTDVVAQGCNCFNAQGGGIAPLFVKHFRTDEFDFEHETFKGKYNKLGCLDYRMLYYKDKNLLDTKFAEEIETVTGYTPITVVNCYTQYNPGKEADYVWLAACLKKLNFAFKSKKLAIPLIGGGIGGLDPIQVVRFMKTHLKNTDTTLVVLDDMYDKLKDL